MQTKSWFTLTAALVVVGCASSRPATQAKPTHSFAVTRVVAQPLHVAKAYAPAKELTPSVAAEPQPKATPLTESGSYVDRYDPSGWGGTSTPPEGIGGGPPAEPAAQESVAPAAQESVAPAAQESAAPATP